MLYRTELKRLTFSCSVFNKYLFAWWTGRSVSLLITVQQKKKKKKKESYDFDSIVEESRKACVFSGVTSGFFLLFLSSARAGVLP